MDANDTSDCESIVSQEQEQSSTECRETRFPSSHAHS